MNADEHRWEGMVCWMINRLVAIIWIFGQVLLHFANSSFPKRRSL